MGMHGQMLRYNGIALLSVGLSSKAEQYSVTYTNCQRIVLHEYHGPFAVSLCGHGHIIICHTHTLLAANDSVLQPLMHAAECDSHWLVMVGKLILPLPLNRCL